LSKRYGKVTVLEGVSFEARAGEAIALWGANGAGKSTLLKTILGLLEFEGRVRVEGCDVRRQGKQARRRIGYVPQDVVFYDQSVRDTLEFYARLKGVGPERISDLIARLGLAEHARKPVPTLSGGLRQRLALAIALLADPSVLLLDEPTASLDAGAQRDYLSLLALLRKEEGKTILFASHRLEEVELLANRVLMLEQGRLVDTLAPVDLLTKLMPDIELTLWVPEARRPEAVHCLNTAGLAAHLNGRGTVVVRLRGEHKMKAFETLQAQDIPVLNFEARGGLWN
jgi:ABC-type multidrug transport system ATPase subunit